MSDPDSEDSLKSASSQKDRNVNTNTRQRRRKMERVSKTSSDTTKTNVKAMSEHDSDYGNVNMDTEQCRKKRKRDSNAPSEISKTNVKVPAFSPDEPEIWFALLEGQFENLDITQDSVKFNCVLSNLDLNHAKAVKDIIIQPPAKNRYEKVKTELIRRLSASHEKKVKQLLIHEELGDRKPSQFLRHLLDLAGPSVPEDFIRTIWSNRLPNNIQTVLASQPTHSVQQLADLADRIQEITQPNVASTSSAAPAIAPYGGGANNEIAELRKMVEHLALKLEDHTRATRRSYDRSRPQQRRTSSRQRSRSNSSYRKYPVCWYHAKFGSKASKCLKPCDYKAENSMGSR
ncbi:uncharacterized protein LOC126380886 [Pectinophora gossypiella]|uniref:uncharacterized protein LOC126380886 n=1 Tax=Pectinophora gossypiella TaxID=13191 RepID=UPI00214E1A58|nr:uncharacterized protein LOC126380886 [Pectinophora gossypiella]